MTTTDDTPRNQRWALYKGRRVELLAPDRSGTMVLARGRTVPGGTAWIPQAETAPLALSPVAVAAE